MRTLFTIALVPIFAGWAAWAVAEEPKPANGILILENEGILEGEVTRQGNWYHIKQALGETVVPAAGVLKIVADHKEAYAYLVKRANLRDPDERIRLTKWCMTYAMRTEAVEQAEAALKLRPNDPYAKFIIKMVKELPPIAAAAAEIKKPTPVQIETALPPDFNQESVPVFATRVQPILMNSCASCHAGSQAGKFVLQRVYSSSDKRGTLANLQAVLKHIDRTDAEKSGLMVKSISAHGTLKNSPLRGRESAPYRHLEEWIKSAFPAGSAPAAPGQSVAKGEAPVRIEEEGPKPVSRPLSSTPAGTSPAKPEESKKATPKPAGPIDPFDPEEFNRLPEKK